MNELLLDLLSQYIKKDCEHFIVEEGVGKFNHNQMEKLFEFNECINVRVPFQPIIYTSLQILNGIRDRIRRVVKHWAKTNIHKDYLKYDDSSIDVKINTIILGIEIKISLNFYLIKH